MKTSEMEEFMCIWIEQTQKWVVLLPTGEVLDNNFGTVGYATNAALEKLNRGEAEFNVIDVGGRGLFFHYKRDNYFWRVNIHETVHSSHVLYTKAQFTFTRRGIVSPLKEQVENGLVLCRNCGKEGGDLGNECEKPFTPICGRRPVNSRLCSIESGGNCGCGMGQCAKGHVF